MRVSPQQLALNTFKADGGLINLNGSLWRQKKPQRLYSAVIKMNINVFTNFNKIICYHCLCSIVKQHEKHKAEKWSEVYCCQHSHLYPLSTVNTGVRAGWIKLNTTAQTCSWPWPSCRVGCSNVFLLYICLAYSINQVDYSPGLIQSLHH